MQRKVKGKPPRLGLIFQRFNAPLFFVTFNTFQRQRFLATDEVHRAFVEYCRRASEFEMAVGRYVIMPDHVHLFVRLGVGSRVRLSDWVKGLKRHLDVPLRAAAQCAGAMAGQKLRSFWQPGFHDHLLRSDESYREKWNYVRDNPVRAGVVRQAEDWPYAGEIVVIDRA